MLCLVTGFWGLVTVGLSGIIVYGCKIELDGIF
jgi:hypothetical protein